MTGNSRNAGFILYLINPLLSLFYVITNYQNQKLRFLMYFIFAFIGYNLVFNMVGADGFRHVQDFEGYFYKNFNEIVEEISVINSRETYTVDYYTTVVNFFISRISSNYSLLFLFHALVFAFFFLKSFNTVYDEFGAKYKVQKLLLLGFIFIMPLWQLNALRYPLALWIWSYGAIHYLYLKNYKYLLFLPLASLVHFGITPATGIFLSFILLGNRIQIYFYAFVITLLVSESISFTFIQDSLQGLGAGIEGRAAGYLSEDYIEMRREGISQTNWYVTGRIKLINYFVLGGLLMAYFFRNKIRFDQLSMTLLSFALFYAAYINLIIDVPSLGGRQRWFLWILVMVLLYRLVSLNLKTKFATLVFYIGFIPILLYALVEFRTGWYFLSTGTIISNPILSLLYKIDISLNDLIQGS